MSDKLKWILSGLLILGVGIAIGRFTLPSKVIEKEHIVYKDKIVEKKVYVQNKDQKNNKVTIRLVTIKPDGTKTIETKIFDKTEIEITQSGESNKTDIKTIDDSKEKIVENSHMDWLVSPAAKYTISDSKLHYGLSINRRILGPIYLGAFGFTDKSFGLSAGLGL